MPKRPFNPTLLLAFAFAVALHAALLPLVLWGVESRVPQERVDLKVSSLDVPASAQAGDLIVAEALLRYEASALSEPVILNQIWLSRDRQIDDGDTRLRIAPSPYALFNHPGDREVMFSVGLPQDADGPYQLILLTDADHKIHNDSERSNNTRATPLYITGPQRPELQITTAELPPTAITGGTVFFSYTTTNRGPGWANYIPPTTHERAGTTPGGWRDAVYLSTDTTLDERDLPLREFHRRAPLAPGDDYQHTRVALDLPRIPPGQYHLILVTDADQVLDQPSFTAGLYTQPIALRDTNLPDLAVAAITAPASATLGQPFPLQWTAANLGSVGSDAEDAGGRVDAVYLSRDDTLDPGDTLLTAQRSDTPIPAQSRTVEPTASVTVPNEPQNPPGEWHLIVVADSENNIDEGPFEDNNAFAVPIVLLPPRDEDDEPDLGEPDNDPRLTVAWIEYERVEQHMARLTETIQPAIQNLVDPDPNAPLVHEPKPPALPAIALQAGGAPNDPAQPVDPNEEQSARPQPPVPDAQDTNVAPRPRDPNAQPPESIDGLEGNGDDLPMPREGEDTPSPVDPDHNPQAVPERSEGADQATPDPNPRNPGDRDVDSDADPDAPDTPSDTDSETPADRDSDTDETYPDDNDSDQPAEVMEESAGDEPNENDPAAEPTEQDGDADNDQDTDEATATPDPAEQDSDRPEGDPVPPSNPSEEQETTRAPRDDAEADPADVVPDRLRLEEGNVLVGQGVRVSTSRIRRGSASSRLTATPRDTLVRIVFDNQGQVVEAEIVGEGTGYEDWDARLLEALYRWTAAGPDIESADPHFVLTLEYQFGLLNRRGE